MSDTALVVSSDTEGLFFFETECPKCDETLYSGANLTTITHRGLPSIDVHMASMATFECPDCRISVCFAEAYPDWEPLDDDDEAVSS